MYTKTINDRQVFSTCKTIQMPDGRWISNPTEAQIAEAGWEAYTPPVIPPTPQTEPGMDDILNAVKKMLAKDADNLSDADALAVAALYPTWSSMEAFKAGERVWYDGKLYKVVQDHSKQSDWTPDAVPALFTEVSVEEFPAWVQPTGAQDAYNTGDKVSYDGRHWESTLDGNVWEPGVAGWSEV